jgi:hypothetical protein
MCGVRHHKCRTQRDDDHKEKEFQGLTSISDKIVHSKIQGHSSRHGRYAWYFRYEARSVAMNGYRGMDDSTGFS